MYYKRIHYTGRTHQTAPSKCHELALWKEMLSFGPAFIWSPAKYAYEVERAERNDKHRIWVVGEDSIDG